MICRGVITVMSYLWITLINVECARTTHLFYNRLFVEFRIALFYAYMYDLYALYKYVRSVKHNYRKENAPFLV
jgi:hypothetical protein